jgi:pimeloyl-ACP methyl ester carboxylesterase
MANDARVQRIDPNDQRVLEARDAERRLFEHYDREYQSHSVELDQFGIKLRVLEVGSGPPLVLVPGGNGDAIEFVPMIAGLEGRRVIAVNRPGAGMSDAIDHRTIDFRRLAVDSMEAVLDAFGLENAPFAVNSMGGLWTLWLALDRPERVSGMVQFGCPALVLGTSAPLPMRFLSVPYLNRLLFRAFRAGSSDDVRKVFGMLGCSEATRAKAPEPYVDAFYRMFSLPTYRLAWLSLMETVLNVLGATREFVLDAADLGNVRQPTQFVWGDNDVFGGVDIGRQAVAAMPNAELQVIAGSHVPYIDNPGECARLTNEYLRQHDTRPIALTDDPRFTA